MSERKAEATPPTPEQLAAYVDGEVDAAGQRQVEAWLAGHADAAADVAAQRQLLALWRKAPLRAPTEAEWSAVFNGIRTAWVAPAQKTVGRRLAWIALALSATAAAAALALWGEFLRPVDSGGLSEVVSLAEVEPFRVATADEVMIISMDAADATFLVIGELPVSEPLVLAAAGEITLDKVEPDVDGMVPRLTEPEWPDAPMIVVPPPSTGVKD
jgi:hypothetical protein